MEMARIEWIAHERSSRRSINTRHYHFSHCLCVSPTEFRDVKCHKTSVSLSHVTSSSSHQLDAHAFAVWIRLK